MTVLANLMSLPWLGYTQTVPNDADWIEGIGYTDQNDSTIPIPLDGIFIEYTVRKALGDPSVLFYATTTNGLIQIGPVSADSDVNSSWFVALYQTQFPLFLPVGTYSLGVRGKAFGATRDLALGTLIIQQGAS